MMVGAGFGCEVVPFTALFLNTIPVSDVQEACCGKKASSIDSGVNANRKGPTGDMVESDCIVKL